jgi:MscS family membrane protein
MQSPHSIRSATLTCLAALLTAIASSSLASGQDLLGAIEKDADKVASTDGGKASIDQAVPEFLSSPAATLDTFMKAMSDAPIDYERAVGCFAIQEGSTASTASTGNKIRAERLHGYLRNLGYSAGDANGVSTAPAKEVMTFGLLPPPPQSSPITRERSNLVEELSNGKAVISLSRWTTPTNGAWLFDQKTLSDDNLQMLRDANMKLIDLDSTLRQSVAENSFEGWLLVQIPPILKNEFLFVMYWQWIGLGGLIFIGLLADRISRLVARGVLRQWARTTFKIDVLDTSSTVMKRCLRSVGLLIATIIWRVGVEMLFLPMDVLEILLVATSIMLILAAVNAGFKTADLLGVFFSTRASQTENKLDDLLVPLLTKSVKILLVIVGFIYFAQAIDVKISPLLAGLGIGGIGFAFAAQNSIENFFGSVTVLLDRPFQVGDWVVIDEVEGTVIAVGMRSSRVRTFYDSVVTLPNSILVNNKVNNYGMRSYRRWTTRLGLLYETSPAQVEAFCEGARELVREHPYMRKDYYQVFLNEFGDSGIEVLVYVFWEAPDWQTELRERHRFMLDLMRLAEELNVSFAYPTQTVYLAKSPRIQDMAEGLEAGQHKAHNEQAGREAARRVTEGARWLEGKPPPYAFKSAEQTRAEDAGAEYVPKAPEEGDTRGSEGE